MKRILLFGILCIALLVPSIRAQGPDTPEPVREAAIQALNEAIPEIGRPDSWRHAGPLSTNNSVLGCDTATGFDLDEAVIYYEVWLKYDELEYKIHVTADGSLVVFCDPKITDNITPPTQMTPPANTTPTTDCTLTATNANVRTEPSTSADVSTVLANVNAVAVLGRTADSNWWQIAEGWIAAGVSQTTGACANVPVTAVGEIDYRPCPPGYAGYMRGRLEIGGTGEVEEGGLPNRVRANPSVTAEQLFQLQPGSVFTVINGPQCGNGFVWWQIETEDGQIGWTAESNVADQDYYLVAQIEGLDANGIVDTQGVKFTYDTALAEDVALDIIEPELVDEETAPFWEGHPGYREFFFVEFVEENDFDPPQPRIRIYPTESMAEYNMALYDQWVALSSVLQDQSVYEADTVLVPSLNDEPLPALPLRNAAQVFATQIRFIEFENGVGIRYITRYAQAPLGSDNRSIFYSFQGLTYDNAYYIVADFPISTDILPDEWTPPASFDQAAIDALTSAEVVLYEALASLNGTQFTPSLGSLDDIIRSLEVK